VSAPVRLPSPPITTSPVDPSLHEVAGGALPPLPLAEVVAAGGADDRAAEMEDASDVLAVERLDRLAAVDETLVALVDRVCRDPEMDRGAHDRPDRGVHAAGIAAAGEHGEAARSTVGHGAILLGRQAAGERRAALGWRAAR
jgi:hypothetical protein